MLALVPIMLTSAAAAVPPIRTVNRQPDFSDYPAAVYLGPLRFPKEREWPDAHWSDAAKTKINFGGHYTHVTISCGIACISNWIVDRKSGQMIRTPDGPNGVQPLSIATMASSNLMKVIWISSRNDGSGETFPPCFLQFLIWNGSSFAAYAKPTETGCPSEAKF